MATRATVAARRRRVLDLVARGVREAREKGLTKEGDVALVVWRVLTLGGVSFRVRETVDWAPPCERCGGYLPGPEAYGRLAGACYCNEGGGR